MNNLPNEIIFKILISTPDFIKNFNSYRLINKRFSNIAQNIIEFYHRKILNITANCKYKPKKLIEVLFHNNEIDDIIFLTNNFNLTKYTSYYAGYYNNLYILNYLNTIDIPQLIKGSVENGNLDIMKQYEDHIEYFDYFKIAKAAGRSCNITVINYISSISEEFNNWIAYGITQKGDIELLKYMINKNADDYLGMAVNAAKTGQLNVIKYAVEVLNCNNLKIICHTAIIKNYLEVIKYIISKGLNDYNWIAFNASLYDNLDIIKLTIINGANNYEQILSNVNKDKRNELVLFIKQLNQ